MKYLSEGPRQIKKISMADQVYQVIQSNIADQTWKKGEKIPSESEIASMLGVNRLTVRLALQKLNVLGFLETRVGEGSFVIGTSFSENISEFAKYYMTPDIVDDVEEFRNLLEMRCIELAILNATDEEFNELEACCDEYERSQKEFHENDNEAMFSALLNADYNYHSTLCKLSHNRLYSYAYSMAKEPICRYIALIISERDERRKAKGLSLGTDRVDDHRRLLNALRRRDIRSSRQVFEDIVDYDYT
jgi:GntR family transcriptional repressor for pyruvate dehydrogenase complex